MGVTYGIGSACSREDEETGGNLPVAGLVERGELRRVDASELHLGEAHELAYHADDELPPAAARRSGDGNRPARG
jgi:hypothetical protein